MSDTYKAERSYLRLVANSPVPSDDEAMSDGMTRDEVSARLQAAEARVAMSTEAIRADMAQLRSEMSMHAERAQANADKFYAQAGKVLAEIELSNSQHKVSMYGIGYKVITWTLGTILAVASVAIGAYRALGVTG